MSLTLVGLRQKIVEQNGRYDLVVDSTDWADNGLDHYINAGLKYLDNHALTPKAYAWYRQDFAVNDYKLKFKNCLSIKEVWIITATDDRWQLTKRSLGYMQDLYYKYSIADGDAGNPINYCETVPRLAPEQKALTSSNYTAEFTYDWELVIFADEGPQYEYMGIWFMPKAETAGTISVLGRFMADPLSSDTDKNFWRVLAQLGSFIWRLSQLVRAVLLQ